MWSPRATEKTTTDYEIISTIKTPFSLLSGAFLFPHFARLTSVSLGITRKKIFGEFYIVAGFCSVCSGIRHNSDRQSTAILGRNAIREFTFWICSIE